MRAEKQGHTLAFPLLNNLFPFFSFLFVCFVLTSYPFFESKCFLDCELTMLSFSLD